MRVLTAGGVKLMLHLLPYLPEFFLLFVIFSALAFRSLRLLLRSQVPRRDVIFIAAAGNRAAGYGFAPELLYMDDHIRGALKKRFVVRNVKHGNIAVFYEIFKPYKRFYIKIV